MGFYSILTNTLTYTWSNVSYPVFKQERGNNYIFYFSHPTWSGWMVGPEVSNNRGGLIKQTTAPCPTLGDHHEQWQFYSPSEGFIPGDISVTCADWRGSIKDDARDKTNYHVHHHYYHDDLNDIQHPAYSIKSKGDIIDARFVFPSSSTANNDSNPIPSV